MCPPGKPDNNQETVKVKQDITDFKNPPHDSIGILNDDCLLLVIKQLLALAPCYGKGTRKGKIQSLTLVNKRFRQLCIPLLFTSTFLSLYKSQLETTHHLSQLPKLTFLANKLLYATPQSSVLKY
jgi:hypothetical protein